MILILLAELIAIKIVLDHVEDMKDEEIENITIFSDSQTAIGILTLNWKSDNYYQTINEIKTKIKILTKHGIEVKLNWTPGHTDINGNEEADILAKEAAKEAENTTFSDITITKQDVKQGARKSVAKNGKRDGNLGKLGDTIIITTAMSTSK